MSSGVVNVSVRLVEGEAADAPPLAPAERRAAMLAQLHAALKPSCPGLTLEALQKMIDERIFDQVVRRLAMVKLLENPQGNA